MEKKDGGGLQRWNEERKDGKRWKIEMEMEDRGWKKDDERWRQKMEKKDGDGIWRSNMEMKDVDGRCKQTTDMEDKNLRFFTHQTLQYII